MAGYRSIQNLRRFLYTANSSNARLLHTIRARPRSFSSQASRKYNGHRTYFQRDSQPYNQLELKQAPPAYSAPPPPPPGPTHSRLSFFLGTLFAFPAGVLAAMYLLANGLIPGYDRPASAEEKAEELQRALESAQSANITVDSLNLGSWKVHNIIAALITPSVGAKCIRDDDMLIRGLDNEPPVTFLNGVTMNERNAAFVRIVTKSGKNVALILAFDPYNGELNQDDEAEWDVDRSPVAWLEKASKKLQRDGKNAVSDIPMIVYCPDYMGVYKGAGHGFIYTRLHGRNFPSGFPMKQMKQIPAADNVK